MNKISGVYQIVNLVTRECYIGSSRNIERRWLSHRRPSTWKRCTNSPLYLDFQKYGLEKFSFEIVEETTNLREREQYYIDLLKPAYNNIRANGIDIEKRKEAARKAARKYQQTEKGKAVHRKYQQTEKGKEASRKHYSQLCSYNGETLTLKALEMRFRRHGIPHPVLEAKKYLLNNN